MNSFKLFPSELPEIDKNDIIWTFNVTAEKLVTVNNIEANYPFIWTSGIYDIEVTHNTVSILSIEYDYNLENGLLTLSYMPESDGPTMTFIPK